MYDQQVSSIKRYQKIGNKNKKCHKFTVPPHLGAIWLSDVCLRFFFHFQSTHIDIDYTRICPTNVWKFVPALCIDLRKTWDSPGSKTRVKVESCDVVQFKMSAPINDNMSTDEKDILCEIEATVTTGFEPTAMEEAVEKLNAEVTVSRGRIILKVPISKVKKVIF